MSDGGKGSTPRPFSVSQEEYDNRWNAIFKNDEAKSKSDAKRIATMTMEMPGTIGTAKIVLPKEE
jgi:hypothetical protein